MPSTPATALDQSVDNLVQKAVSTQSSSSSWIWSVVGGVVVAGFAWWVKYLLQKKDVELAQARTDLEQAKLKAQQDAVRAQTEVLEEQRTAYEKAASDSLLASRVLEDKLQTDVAANATRWVALNAVQKGDWDTLNKLAGVKT